MSANQPRDRAGRFGTVPRAEATVGLQSSQDLLAKVIGNGDALAAVPAVRARLADPSDVASWDMHPDDADAVVSAAERAPDEVIAAAVVKLRRAPFSTNVHTVEADLAAAVSDCVKSAVADGWHDGRPPAWH